MTASDSEAERKRYPSVQGQSQGKNVDVKSTPDPRTYRKTVFDRTGWLYGFCRNRLFRDDTETLARTLCSLGTPLAGATLVELGCGPGHYATQLAERYRLLDVIGVDCSRSLVDRAVARSRFLGLGNCRFELADACCLPWSEGRVDVVLCSRLLMMVACRRGVVAEAFRVLRPGGIFLLTEPVPSLGTDFAIAALRLVDRCTTLLCDDPSTLAEEEMAAIDPAELRNLLACRPWAKIVAWRNAGYHYASCTKSPRALALLPPRKQPIRSSRIL